MSNSIGILSQNIIFPFITVFMWFFFYYLQKNTIRKDSLLFLKNRYKRGNIIFSFVITSFFICLYIIVGVFAEFKIQAGGATIFEITLNYGLIIITTLLIGCFYASIAAVLGNVLAFYVSPDRGGLFLFTFSFIRGFMPIVPYMLMILLNKYKRNKLIIDVIQGILFTISTGCLIVAILIYNGNISLDYRNGSSVFNSPLRYATIITVSIIFIAIFLYIIFSRFKRFDFLRNGYLLLIITSMLIYVIIISFILDPFLLSYLLNNTISYKELYTLRLSTAILSLFINIVVFYTVIRVIKLSKSINFLCFSIDI